MIAWTKRHRCLNGNKTFERRLELYHVRWFPCDCWGPPPLLLYKMPADERNPGRAGMGWMCGQHSDSVRPSYSNVFNRRPFQLPLSEIAFFFVKAELFTTILDKQSLKIIQAGGRLFGADWTWPMSCSTADGRNSTCSSPRMTDQDL